MKDAKTDWSLSGAFLGLCLVFGGIGFGAGWIERRALAQRAHAPAATTPTIEVVSAKWARTLWCAENGSKLGRMLIGEVGLNIDAELKIFGGEQPASEWSHGILRNTLARHACIPPVETGFVRDQPDYVSIEPATAWSPATLHYRFLDKPLEIKP